MVKSIGILAVCLSLGMLSPPLAAETPRRPGSIGISVASLSNPFFKAIARAALARAMEINPAVRVSSADAEFDPVTQSAQIDRFVAEKVDLIILAASHGSALAPAIERAHRAGIPVIAVDIETEGADASIHTDNRRAGKLACRYLAERLKGQGTLLIQNGPQVLSVIDRVAGCRAALAEFRGIKILGDSGDGLASPWGGAEQMRHDLKRFPRIDAVFAVNDRQALGVETVIRQAGLSDILIAAVDGSPDIQKAMSRSGMIVASAIQDPADMGRQSVDLGSAILEGRSTGGERILMPTELLTRENLGQYRGWESD